jgi:biotin synthase
MFQRTEALAWLMEPREEALEELWRRADEARRAHVGEAVHLRGLVEISNHCVRRCHYCGIRVDNRELTRYRMSDDEVLACARAAAGFGYGTVVLQAGEDPGITRDGMAALIRSIKRETRLAVTLSLGERSLDDAAAWRDAGADRYLLRFETSNRALFRQIHPPAPGQPESDRIELLKELRRLGYEVGSGVMIGIPGQTHDDLANDLELFHELDLDMIGVGPFIPHPATPLAASPEAPSGDVRPDAQAPRGELMTYKMIALARLACPRANIPSTTALATLNLAQGRELGLQRGANILMPNMTPPRYRVHYEIYPAKACIDETAEQCHGCMRRRVESIGRHIGKGAGGAPAMAFRAQGRGEASPEVPEQLPEDDRRPLLGAEGPFVALGQRGARPSREADVPAPGRGRS